MLLLLSVMAKLNGIPLQALLLQSDFEPTGYDSRAKVDLLGSSVRMKSKFIVIQKKHSCDCCVSEPDHGNNACVRMLEPERVCVMLHQTGKDQTTGTPWSWSLHPLS